MSLTWTSTEKDVGLRDSKEDKKKEECITVFQDNYHWTTQGQPGPLLRAMV